MIFTRILLLVTTIFMLNGNGYSQTADARIPKVVPPSPNPAALQKYGDYPVSAYTGVPSISIPIYEIKSGDISVPVSISYNASGIKVADEASRVGLGWVLNAGGALSRNIIGKDDWDDYMSQTFGDIPLGQKFDQGANFNYMFNCLMQINGYSLPQVLLNDQLTDFQPDQYSYNFNGYSGKFVLRRNKDVILQRVEKIDIKVLDNYANVWEIKTPTGFVYRFQDIESYIDGSTSRKSTWYLSKITSPTGRIVQFVYTPITLNIQPAGSYFESRPVGFAAGTICSASLPSVYANIITGKTYSSLYLSKIIFDQGEVQFNYSSGRVDVSNEVQLDNIKIYEKRFGEPVNALLKTWTFNYSYFTGTSINGWSAPSNPDLINKRLKLLSLQESSPVGTIPAYNFTYNNDGESIGTLPSKLSFARDHWGFFNGNLGNTSLIPTFTGTGPGTLNIGTMGSERNADAVKSQLFLLNKIKFPTGGSTLFEYESNDFDQPASMINDHSFFAESGSAVATNVQTSFSNTSVGGTFTGTLDLRNMYPSAQDVIFEASFVKLSGFAPGSNPIMDITCSLKDPAGVEIGGGQPAAWLGNSLPPKTEYLGTSSSNSGIKVTLKKSLTPGIYTWSFYVPAAYNIYVSSVVAYYTMPEGSGYITNGGENVYNALLGGGVRIKRITDYTDPVTPALVKKYYYHYKGTDNKIYSYGRRMAKPNYSYYEFVPGSSGSGTCSAACLFRESDSNIPLNGSTNGVAVAYDQVEELSGENGENGKTVYTYRNQPDNILDYRVAIQDPGVTIPLKPPYGGIIPDAGNGNLLKQKTLANINGKFIANSEQTNIYQDLTDIYQSVVYGIDKRVASSNTVPGMNCGILSFYVYPALTKNRHVLVSSSSSKYDVNGLTSPVTSSTEYTYDNSTHLQLVSQSQFKSNGDKVTTRFKYPADYADAQSDAANLLMKNASFMHALPVEKQVSITHGTDQLLIDASITKYQVIGSTVFPKEMAILENTAPININTPPTGYNPASGTYPSGYTARVFYDNYDVVGNITQVHKSNDVYMSYIWDYYGNYPVAEVNNADASSIAFSSFESDGKGNWSFSGTPLNDAQSFTGKRTYTIGANTITKTGLSTSNIYVVSYWSKSGSATVNGSTATAGITRGLWTYFEHILPASTSSITISGSSATIDELRLFPKGALMTSYTFEPLLGMTSSSDANNRITYYEYDDFLRLRWIKDQDGNIVKTIEYKYKL